MLSTTFFGYVSKMITLIVLRIQFAVAYAANQTLKWSVSFSDILGIIVTFYPRHILFYQGN